MVLCRRLMRLIVSTLTLLGVSVALAIDAEAQSTRPSGEWHATGGDHTNTKYSPLDDITPENFLNLEVAWRWTSIETEVTAQKEDLRPLEFKTTPLMIDGLVYASTSIGQVAAIDAGSGEVVWSYDPRSYERMERPGNMGWHHRGVAYWKDTQSDDARIVIALPDWRLVALNAKSGDLYPNFGHGGWVDMSQTVGREINPARYTHSSPVAIARDVVVVGSIVQDTYLRYKEATPGNVRGYDVRTGDLKWTFNTIPQEGEFGVETWEDRSWEYSGHSNVWGTMAVDDELGYVYLPTGTPTNDYYGGMRRGDNLFAESIVAVDVETGERVWHFQAVHHGLWDYDFPTAGNLLDITVDGREIKAIAQTSKQAFTYVLDRVTGEPVWPIEERPVPQGDVPGEWYAPTQPFPTKPPPFDLQGVTEDDLINFTPELRAEALQIVAENARLGPIFTPPTLRGTQLPVIQAPGTGGGINWPGSAVDPETGRLFVPSQTRLRTVELIPYEAPATTGYFTDPWAEPIPGPDGLPIVKPPYKRVTAFDLNSGEQLWMTPHGDGPRNHPRLRGLNLPALGGGAGMHHGGALVTKSMLFVNSGGRNVETMDDVGPTLTGYDKDTGDYLGSINLPSMPAGNPISYEHEDKQYIVLAIGGRRDLPELIALALP